MKYRREIDGLRAIAVVPVIFFHAGIPVFSGGFVGVDVFFVISGYLITTIIISDMAQTSGFSLIRFCERRVRRILPALFFVLIVSLPFAYYWMYPFQLREFGRNLLGAALFVSNITLWRQGGYFGGTAEENPLLHTWSLSVEEQFYMFFPLSILFIYRFFGWRGLWTAIFAVLLMSVGLAEWSAKRDPIASFYLLPTRAWELAAGALVGMYLFHRSQPSGGFCVNAT